jgi:hypothetical protein
VAVHELHSSSVNITYWPIRVISLLRNNQVAFKVKRTSMGKIGRFGRE